jgi:hypothetical protein
LLVGTTFGDAVIIRLFRLDDAVMRPKPLFWLLWFTLVPVMVLAGETGPRILALGIGGLLGAGMLWVFYRLRLIPVPLIEATHDMAPSNNT